MKCSEWIQSMEKLCPPQFAMSWDNPGLIAGSYEQNIQSVFIALDATDEVIEAAIRLKTDMLLCHHPLIFGTISQINDKSFTGRRLLKLIENQTGCYAMHTNFDVAVMADLAADYMGLSDCMPLETTVRADCGNPSMDKGIGKFGLLPETITLKACAALVKSVFNIPHVSVFGNMEKNVRKAAICPGSGKGMAVHAAALGADVLITGDIGHHDGIDANAMGIAVIDAGHQGLEHIFIDYMKTYIDGAFPELTVYTENSRAPFTVI